MKKNRMMRLASGLLVAVLLTTSVISGTFAKYTTSASSQDSARVAKWGVTVTAQGDAFLEDYEMDDVNQYFTYSVESSIDDDKVIAPGTKGTFGGIDIKGTPEVAVDIKKEATLTLEGWMIDEDKNVTTPDIFYCPITITIGSTDICGLNYLSSNDFIEEVEQAIEFASGQYVANTKLDAISGMSGAYGWRWSFVDEGIGKQDDEKDTMLGDLAANGSANKITLEVSAKVTQID